jgi:flavodoxin
MKVSIFYDTFFGNTRKVAQFVGNAIKEVPHDVEVSSLILDWKKYTCIDSDLIILGSPTRHYFPSKKIILFMFRLKARPNQKIALFDTRMDTNWFANIYIKYFINFKGTAINKMIQIARFKNYNIVSTKSFFVEESTGPFEKGQKNKIILWNKELINLLQKNHIPL